MEEINQFFDSRNTVYHISEEDKAQLGNYLEAIDAFSRITYKSIYVIDYEKKCFEYVSDNPLFLCGLSSKEVLDLGYAFYFRFVKKEDLDLLLKINEIGFEFFERVPIHERKTYTISYDFHLVNEKKKTILINHRLTPIFLNEKGKIWKAMCVVALSSNYSAGNITITKQGSNDFLKFDLSSNSWMREEKPRLSEREQQILEYSAKGMSLKEISEKVFLSTETVKFHRKKITEKTGTQNISEAISYAKMNKLI